MTTAYKIESGMEISKGENSEYQWWHVRNTTEDTWKQDLKDLRKYNPKIHYRVLKEITITEVVTETIA